MPDKRKHRGAHPRDTELFAPDKLPALQSAVKDLSWLLTRGYASPSSQKIVGDRYNLTRRQRIAVARAACSDQDLARRRASCIEVAAAAGKPIAVDGYNLLISIESALAGGVIVLGCDSTCRDLAGIHGSYRTMAETLPALEVIGRELAALDVGSVLWLLDSPVSNSGRLRAKMVDLAASRQWPWRVELHADPDTILVKSNDLIVSSDSFILDGCRRWLNLARHIIDAAAPEAWVVDLR